MSCINFSRTSICTWFHPQQQARFTTMGSSILGRMDEMGSRIEDLEKSITSLMDQAGVDHSMKQHSGRRPMTSAEKKKSFASENFGSSLEI
jgi:Heat shock factor binding protein 1